jgi:hypothetical protein
VNRRHTGRPPAGPASPARGEGGFIILGCLILIVVVLVVGVLLGKIFRKQDRWIVSTEGRSVRHAVRDVEVRYADQVIRVIPRGDSAWVYPLPDGVVAVYTSPDEPQVDGFAPDSLFR